MKAVRIRAICSAIFLTLPACLLPVSMAAASGSDGATGNPYLTVDDVVYMESAAEFQISPDGEWVVWVKIVPNKSKNKQNRHIYLSNAKEDLTLQMTRGNNADRSPKFSPDGKRVAFLSARGEKAKQQIYTLDLRGGEARKITSVENGVTAFEWLDDKTFVFSAREDSTLYERTLTKNKDDVVVVADQEHYAPIRLFKYDVDSKKTTRVTINQGAVTEFALSPDKKTVVASENMSVDYSYDRRIPPKQFIVDLEAGNYREICGQPHVDPYDFEWADNSRGFYCRRRAASDSTDTFVGISRLYYYDLAGNRLTRVSTGSENGLGRSYGIVKNGIVAALANGVTDRIVHLTSRDDKHDRHTVHTVRLEKPARLAAAQRGGDRVVYFSSDASSIPKIFTGTLSGDRIEHRRELFVLNDSFSKKTLTRSEVIRWSGARGETVEGILYYPVDYDPAHLYPLVASIHGGPSGVDPDFFTERWSNYPHVLASKGVFVLKVNYHGSGNYGIKWVESIKGRYYELEVPDILSGIDYVIANKSVYHEAIGIMGWSNGSILAIQCCIESDRFKVLCAGAGDVNWTSDYGNCAFGAAFDNAYFGGPPWENAQTYVDKSPLFDLERLKTPTLIMFGSKDTSVPTEQGWQHFRAMQQIGAAPVRFLLFPGAGHGPTKLSHRKRKMEEELAWFDKYLFDNHTPKNEAFDEHSPLAYELEKARIKKVGFLIGQRADASLVPEIVELDGIRVSRFEITCAQFGAFDPNFSYPMGRDNHPVTEISPSLAQAYCLWLFEKTGRRYRLPTGEEMEKLLAATRSNLPHENNLEYWLGYTPNPGELETVREKIEQIEKTRLLIEPVGSFRQACLANDTDRSTGIYDLGGNVAEWVMDETGHGKIMGLSAISLRDPRIEYSRPPLTYVGFRVVETD